MYNTTFFLKVDRQAIDPQMVIWLEGDWNYTRIYRKDQPACLSAYTLKWYERALHQFIRVRKNAIVNPEHVIAFQCTSDIPRRLLLTLSCGRKIDVSRRRQAYTKRYLKELNINEQVCG